MRMSKKIIISAVSVASLAGVAGPVLATAASAAPAVTVAAVNPMQAHWNLSGSNQVKLVYQGVTYTYKVQFRQLGNQLFGTLTDSYLPGTLPVNGLVNGGNVMFYVSYGGVQGDRAFIGNIGTHGAVSGNWTETGSEQGSGTFTLAHAVRH